jgi:D-glycerate 3-kinase
LPQARADRWLLVRGDAAPRGSASLCTAIVGGAVVPLFTGMVGSGYEKAVGMSPLEAAVLAFCRAQLTRQSRRPVMIGIQGPQGSGKTTLARALLDALPAQGLSGTTVSIDDFYWTRAGQLEVAAAHPGNAYLEHRGYPGTHDIDLGEQVLSDCRGDAASGPRVVTLPVYDKSAHGGRGDRAPAGRWRAVPMPVDLVFVEGWMLGFTPVPPGALRDPDLAAPNHALAAYERWYRQIDAWVILRALDPNYVLRWRVEAEELTKASGQPGLSRADIEDYVRRFLPAYATWGGAPDWVPPDRCIELWLDRSRQLVRG